MNPLRTTAIITLLLLPASACDDRVLAEAGTPCDPGLAKYEPHPYTTCSGAEDEDPSPYHPACEGGCGFFGDDDDGQMVCAIPCSTNADCDPWDGDGTSVNQCISGRCYLLCNGDEYQCASDLECYPRGDGFDGVELWGECMAPWPPK